MSHPLLSKILRPAEILFASGISAQTGLEVILISEVNQLTGSFKIRSAFNLALQTQQQRLLVSSSGNFGIALSYAGKMLNKSVKVVMPGTASKVKISAIEKLGGCVDLVDVRVTTRAERVRRLSQADPSAYALGSFDDPRLVEGNSTLGHEISAARLGLDAILVPVGGGSLSCGIIAGLRRSGDQTPVWGVEPVMANDLARSLRSGRLLPNEREPMTIADGARTRCVGRKNWQLLRDGLDGVLEVDEESIVGGVQLLAHEGIRAEPTGAMTVGALLNGKLLPGKRIGCIVSGGNVDESVYQSMLWGEQWNRPGQQKALNLIKTPHFFKQKHQST